MTAKFSESNLKRMEDWAGQLACPVCFGDLRVDTARAVCAECGRVYPVVDGIAVLIAERAETPEPSAE
jgi:uncharacterized protein YbaR (Trm112 family)